jgi:hypothetical protein
MSRAHPADQLGYELRLLHRIGLEWYVGLLLLLLLLLLLGLNPGLPGAIQPVHRLPIRPRTEADVTVCVLSDAPGLSPS